MRGLLAGVAIALVVGVAGVAIYRRASSQRQSVSDGTMPLRDAVLSRELFQGAPPATPGVIRAVVFEWDVGSGVATLAAFEDGTTSIYLSSGGGVIGAGEHESVKQAAAAFRDEATRMRSQFTHAAQFPRPPSDHARFYLITESVTLGSSEILSADLEKAEHPLATLARLAQDVIAAVRKAS